MTLSQLQNIKSSLGILNNTWVCPKEIYRITIVKWENIMTFNYNVYIKFDDDNELLKVCTINHYTPEQYQRYISKYSKLDKYAEYPFPEQIVYKRDINGVLIKDSENNPIVAYYLAPARGEKGEILEDLYGYQYVKIFTWKVFY